MALSRPTRCLSWEEASCAPAGEPSLQGAAEGEAGAPEGAAPPLSTPLPENEREAAVEALHAYMVGLGGAAGGAAGVQLPDGFSDLVESLVEARRHECSAERGWVSTAAASATAPPPPTAPAPLLSQPAAKGDAKLGAALLKVQQLDGALAAADKRAAAAATAARRASLGAEALGGAGEGLQGAMTRERTRLRQEEQLQRALQEGSSGDGGSAADPFAGGTALTAEQEAALEALLRQPEDAGLAANPYALAGSELAALDAQLAALNGGAGDGGSAGVGGSEADGPASDGLEEDADLETARASYQRVQEEARQEACRLRGIDAALRALRTGGAAVC